MTLTFDLDYITVMLLCHTASDSSSCGELAGSDLPRHGDSEICEAREPLCCHGLSLRPRVCRLCVHLLRVMTTVINDLMALAKGKLWPMNIPRNTPVVKGQWTRPLNYM